MATAQIEIKDEVLGLSTEAFELFCEDIAGMFGVDIKCTEQGAVRETVKGLKKRFKKLAAVNTVKAEGALDGTFQLIFDQGGLFTISGVIVMLPEKRILEETKRGTIKDVESMNDAIKETGNLLIGAWDRVFREELEGHGHFAQASTFIGKPWVTPEESIGLASDADLTFVEYEFTIDPYPPFTCGVIFPDTIFDATSEPDSEEAADDTAEQPSDEEKADAASAEDVKEDAGKKTKETAETEPAPKGSAEEQEDDAEEPAPDEAAEDKKEETAETEIEAEPAQPVETGDVFLASCAKDIMDKDIVWGSGNDSVQETLTKMQQADAGYMVVGTEGKLEGIVSKTDILGAISPYLRPLFAKWHRPQDDASLQIKIKWIMSRPVHTVKPETPLITIVEKMCKTGNRCMPVVDPDNKVQGVVTVFDIFRALLKSVPNGSVVGKVSQSPPLISIG